MLRVFHEARSEMYVDRAVLQKTMNWLLKHQKADGSFNEFGHVVDPQMVMLLAVLVTRSKAHAAENVFVFSWT